MDIKFQIKMSESWDIQWHSVRGRSRIWELVIMENVYIRHICYIRQLKDIINWLCLLLPFMDIHAYAL